MSLPIMHLNLIMYSIVYRHKIVNKRLFLKVLFEDSLLIPHGSRTSSVWAGLSVLICFPVKRRDELERIWIWWLLREEAPSSVQRQICVQRDTRGRACVANMVLGSVRDVEGVQCTHRERPWTSRHSWKRDVFMCQVRLQATRLSLTHVPRHRFCWTKSFPSVTLVKHSHFPCGIFHCLTLELFCLLPCRVPNPGKLELLQTQPWHTQAS